MVTRSEAGGHLPPVLGALSATVTTKRLDLVSLRGHIVRVPRTLDVDIAEGSTRVWVHSPMCLALSVHVETIRRVLRVAPMH